MSGDKKIDVPATLRMAEILLTQGDIWKAEKIFLEILEKEPGNARAEAGLKRCRAMKSDGEKSLREKKLAILRLLLARLQGQPAPVIEKSSLEKARKDPRQRRLEILQTLLEKVKLWQAEVLGRETQRL